MLDHFVDEEKFTFHYVSIKSLMENEEDRVNRLIYIPLCIY